MAGSWPAVCEISLLWQLMNDKKVTLGNMRMYLTTCCDWKHWRKNNWNQERVMCKHNVFQKICRCFFSLPLRDWSANEPSLPNQKGQTKCQTKVLAALIITSFFTYCKFCPEHRWSWRLITNHRNVTSRSQLHIKNLTDNKLHDRFLYQSQWNPCEDERCLVTLRHDNTASPPHWLSIQIVHLLVLENIVNNPPN